jgi:hypothetical protein
MEFCPHCRRMVPVQKKTVDVKDENERHVQTVCGACKQVIFEAVRPLDQEPAAADKPPKIDLRKPVKHAHVRPQPKKKA